MQLRTSASVLTALAALSLGGAAPLPPPDPAERIDEYFAALWRRENVHPTRMTTDAEFLRRASLDLAGRIPSVDEVREFLAERSPDKRERAIDRLTTGPGYAVYWSEVWLRILRTDEPSQAARLASRVLAQYLEAAFGENQPFDQMAREMLTASGEMISDYGQVPGGMEPRSENPATAYLVQFLGVPEGRLDAAQAAANHFLGYTVSCARCHDHKTAEWTQREYYEWAAYFQDLSVDVQRLSQDPPQFQVTLVPRRRGELIRLPDGGMARPRFLGSPEAEASIDRDRRGTLAQELTAGAGRLQFARATVNRVWGVLLGRGLVHPADGFDPPLTNPHAEILEFLAEEFIRAGWDFRRLLSTLARTRVYQLASEKPRAAHGDPDPSLFSVAAVRPLMAVQLLTSLQAALGAPEADRGQFRLRRQVETVFDVDPDNLAAYKVSLQQALVVMNHSLLEGGMTRRLRQLGREFRTDPGALLEELYLSFLSRPPTDDERRFLRSYPAEDVAWALMNSSEFALNH